MPNRETNRQIILRSRPHGMPSPDDFELVDAPMPAAGDGEVLCRTVYLSLDPYMRGRMSTARSYAAPAALGQVMQGGTVGRVLVSHAADLQPGAFVVGYGGWQDSFVASARSLRKLDPEQAPVSTALGVLGMPGMTAYVGLLDIGRPKEGETVVVSAAGGAVGSVAGQIAKIKGCRAVGVAGSQAKCDYVVREYGFDACVNYKAENLDEALRTACPAGVDVYFENVGGAVLAAVLRLINRNARIPLCGLISQYNATEPVHGPNLGPVLANRALIQGFIISDHAERQADFLRDCARWVREGRLRYREDVVDGLEHAPVAFLKLFRGENEGKLLVRVGDERAD